MNSKKILITNPIFYPNAKPHLGTAHTMILSDFLKRCFEILGYDVCLTLGLDEHSEKVEKTAIQNNMSTVDFVNKLAKIFKDSIAKLNINYDIFIRTSDDNHKEAVKVFWNHMFDKGLIYKGKYSGYYSVSDETFFTEKSLINGKAPTGADVTWENTDAYFFKSSLFKEQLMNFYNKNSNLTTPSNKINELVSFVKDEFTDLCVSRKKGWGISVPQDKAFTIYVWFDALINYLTVCNYPYLNSYWNSRVIQIIGKDIAIFHGVHWPSMLLAHENIKIFDDLLIHNWWLIDDNKMSKSKGNIIDPLTIVEKYGINVLRFFCIKENLISSDSSFDIKNMINAYNTFLVGKFSNLVYRLWVILYRDKKTSKIAKSNKIMEEKLARQIENLEINNYVNTLFYWCDELNSKIDQTQAWKNSNIALDLFSETITLVKYFDCITPGIYNLLITNEEPVIFFHKIIT